MVLKSKWYLACMVLLSSCFTFTDPKKRLAPESSSLSEVSVSLPDKVTITGPVDKITGYRIIIEEIATGAVLVNETRAWGQTSAITKSVTQGKDYSIGMELGILAQDKSKLTPVLFTNWQGPKQGTLLAGQSTKGKSSVVVELTLAATQAAIDLGFLVQSIETPKPTDVEIKPKIGGQIVAFEIIVVPAINNKKQTVVGNYNPPGNFVVTNLHEWNKYINLFSNDQVTPPVDLSKKVLVISAKEAGSSGYQIEIRNMLQLVNNEINVDVVFTRPHDNCGVATVMTYPVVYAALDKTDKIIKFQETIKVGDPCG